MTLILDSPSNDELLLTDSTSQEIISKQKKNNQSQGKVVNTITRKKTLRKMLISESGEKIYVCYLESCSRHFTFLSSLIKHERIHRNQKPYVCTVCGSQFRQSSNLKRHERSHTGEKDYPCDHCPKRFSTSYNLRQHMQIHSEGVDVANFNCSNCKKSYTYVSSLIKHQKSCVIRHPDQADSLNESLEGQNSPRKIIKSEPKLESNSNCSTFKEEVDCLSHLKENAPENNDSSAQIPQAKAREFSHVVDEEQDCSTNFNNASPQSQASPSPHLQNSNISADQVLFQMANPCYRLNLEIQKTVIANNLLLSQLASNILSANPVYNVEFRKQLEEIINFRKMIHNTFFFGQPK